jgi:hypothetical protein
MAIGIFQLRRCTRYVDESGMTLLKQDWVPVRDGRTKFALNYIISQILILLRQMILILIISIK